MKKKPVQFLWIPTPRLREASFADMTRSSSCPRRRAFRESSVCELVKYIRALKLSLGQVSGKRRSAI